MHRRNSNAQEAGLGRGRRESKREDAYGGLRMNISLADYQDPERSQGSQSRVGGDSPSLSRVGAGRPWPFREECSPTSDLSRSPLSFDSRQNKGFGQGLGRPNRRSSSRTDADAADSGQDQQDAKQRRSRFFAALAEVEETSREHTADPTAAAATEPEAEEMFSMQMDAPTCPKTRHSNYTNAKPPRHEKRAVSFAEDTSSPFPDSAWHVMR
jgi:hypothetical protein